jgi:hypothetical protein
MNAQEIIMEIEKLPQEEKQVVVDFAVSIREDVYKEADYSLEDEEDIIKEAKLCKQGVDTKEHSSADELLNSLGLT